MDVTNKWVTKELELLQRHEQLLKQREALMRTTECYFNVKTSQADTFVTDIHTASVRNKRLLDEMRVDMNDLRRSNKPSNKLDMLKNNYWVMVEKVFPIWCEEYKEYEKRKNKNENSKISVDSVRPAAQSNYLAVPQTRSAVSQSKQTLNSTMESTRKSTGSKAESRSKSTATTGTIEPNKSTEKQPIKTTGRKKSTNSTAVIQSSKNSTLTHSMSDAERRSHSVSSLRSLELGSTEDKVRSRRVQSEQKLTS